MFQFTHPGGVRLVSLLPNLGTGTFQFTHPGGVRLSRGDADSCILRVSIHAPGRGATKHARRRTRKHASFNSRTREGCDATALSYRWGTGRFNSRTREGCDYCGQFQLNNDKRFQFTHPGGVRLGDIMEGWCSSMFQFTHPGGVRRAFKVKVVPTTQVSIHAPGRGATGTPRTCRRAWACFNSRTREGCDFGCRDTPALYQRFNSRTREGCDQSLVS